MASMEFTDKDVSRIVENSTFSLQKNTFWPVSIW